MPEENIGFGPAALEQPETDNFSTKNESLAEQDSAKQEVVPAPIEKSGKYEKLLQSVTSASSQVVKDETKDDILHVQSLEGEGAKVEQLVKLAHDKGLAHAVHVAERLKDYYALDVFHDTLADNLYDSLVQEGLISKE